LPGVVGKGTSRAPRLSGSGRTEGGNSAKLQIFRQVREALQQQVLDFLVQWEADTPQFHLN